MKKQLSLFSHLIAATLCLLTAHAWGWGGMGHSVVGEIAFSRLSPEARRQVTEILDGETLADVASWADQVRPERAGTAPLHYINFPAGQRVPSREDLMNPRGNVYIAVLGYADRLADDELDPESRSEALKFLVHFTGDVHQPLHCGLADDRGGNGVRVIFNGSEMNLHRVWDSQLLSAHQGTNAAALAATLLAQTDLEVINSYVSVNDPIDWIAESRGVMDSGIYDLPEELLPAIGADYTERFFGVAEQCLVAAGVRLGVLLERILATGESPYGAPPTPLPTETRGDFGPTPLYQNSTTRPATAPSE